MIERAFGTCRNSSWALVERLAKLPLLNNLSRVNGGPHIKNVVDENLKVSLCINLCERVYTIHVLCDLLNIPAYS